MGRKSKVGKQRKDRYYHLAKETGYRSRSAFKLIQLNRKYTFLQQSRVLIDLCAAPGGWLQVASRNMPVSSMIIGVDLFPIKPIRNVVTFTCDITTTKCRMQLRKEMKTWKADCILHDGAPNVGASWVLDAFTQAQLTLHALKLACEFLNKGGWFVTKVFRSKDYQPLLWVFHQMFRKVHVTKPQASRNESAEIFVVCQSYIAPDKIDAKFFDPKYIFKEVGEDTKQKVLILRDPSKIKKAKAEGYEEGDYTLYHPLPVSEYMSTDDPLELLNKCSELVFDDASIASHHLTSAEIKLCCRDIKVLGRREVRDLLNWHRKYSKERAEAEAEAKAKREEEMAQAGDKDVAADNDEDEDDEVAKQLAEVKEEERVAERRKKKDALKKRKKLRERLQKTKELQSSMGDNSQGESLFGLVTIKNKQQLQEIHAGALGAVDTDENQPVERAQRQLPSLKPVKLPKDMEEEELEDDDDDDDSCINSELDEDEANALRAELERANDRYDDGNQDMGSEDEPSIDESAANPLIVDLNKEDPAETASRKTRMWFRKGAFTGLDEEDDEDIEISQASKDYELQGGAILERPERDERSTEENGKAKSERSVRFSTTVKSIDSRGQEDRDELSTDGEGEGAEGSERSDQQNGGPPSKSGSELRDSSESSDSDYDDEVMMSGSRDGAGLKESSEERTGGKKKRKASDGFETVQAKKTANLPNLDPEGLALGTLMATSKKSTREIIEHAYNRYTYGDKDRIPDWLRKDESQHCRRNIPVTKELVEAYRARLREINARPIRKVAEAKARKKKRQVARQEKLRKKAQAISDVVDASETEKMQQIRNLYRKLKVGNKKKDVTYVVTRKHQASKRVRRPKGVKGAFKVVDPRMKKDTRGMKRAEERRKKSRKR